MSEVLNKLDFEVLVSVRNANPNGDPLNANRPRTDYNDIGEISDVCIKRKIRNRMQDLGYKIFVQSSDRSDDGASSLAKRYNALFMEGKGKSKLSQDEIAKKACSEWLDVRAFGQVFAYKSKKEGDKETDNAKGDSIGIRGPVTIQYVNSVSPVDVKTIQIVRSVNGSDSKDKKGSDTMGKKHMIGFGLYVVKGSINSQLASKTGFTHDDAMILKKCLQTLFVNDASSARPEGSMEVIKLFWWEHNCPLGQYSSAKVHRSVSISLKEGVEVPSSVDDYDIHLDELPGLKLEIVDGL